MNRVTPVNIRTRSITLRGSCEAALHGIGRVKSFRGCFICHFRVSHVGTINLLLLTFRSISDIKLFKKQREREREKFDIIFERENKN